MTEQSGSAEAQSSLAPSAPQTAWKNGEWVIATDIGVIWGPIRGMRMKNEPGLEGENLYLVVPMAEVNYQAMQIPSTNPQSPPETVYVPYWQEIQGSSNQRKSKLYRGIDLHPSDEFARQSAHEASALIKTVPSIFYADSEAVMATGHDLVRQMLDDQEQEQERDGERERGRKREQQQEEEEEEDRQLLLQLQHELQ